ncbi:hypothetical protein [Mycobacterium avium]|uniref:hypothetical protein n=1 Tax=Mycobacterium avium TaxID=1764 RepID=UPI001CC7FB9B|nr:hypothetical protein [Mycobacterium avium]MBZ4521822.1 hypothetical protein [Mycobacterium avium subsp. hominissuis]MBZ4531166.1 hypothetical protein [Mycobacterium avium subsp. hominissuis]
MSIGALAAAAFGTTVAPSARADVRCTGQQAPNPAKPDFYQRQYSAAVSVPLRNHFAAYQSAADSDDPQQTGRTANILYGEIETDLMMFGTQTWFGCYDPGVLAILQQSADTFAATLDDISGAAANFSGKTPEDVPALVAQAQPQGKAYIDALNAYAGQFGGEQIAEP